MNRGDRGEDIFLGDDDRDRFLGTLGEVCDRTDWQIHAYCLMGNHFHMVLETPLPTLVSGMKWMLGTYTQRFNARHRLRGHLFAGRYKALSVDESDAFYLRTVCDYVHLNPVRAGLVGGEAPLESHRWSSYPAYLGSARNRPPWLRVDRLQGGHGIGRDDARGRREFARRMEGQRLDPLDGDIGKRIRRGWQFGSEDFVDRLRDRMSDAVADRHESAFVRESMASRAGRIVEEELARERMHPRSLEALPKGAPIKIRIARRLRESTTLTLKEISVILHAGAWRSLANALSRRNVSK
jgi:REP element-mobilizing transposase RayT